MIIEIPRGDEKKLDFKLVNYDGNAFNLTNYTVYFMAKEKKSDLDSAAVIDKSSAGGGVTIVNAVNGEITLNLVADDTDLDEKTYYCDFRMKSDTEGPYSTEIFEIVITPTVRKGFA